MNLRLAVPAALVLATTAAAQLPSALAGRAVAPDGWPVARARVEIVTVPKGATGDALGRSYLPAVLAHLRHLRPEPVRTGEDGRFRIGLTQRQALVLAQAGSAAAVRIRADGYGDWLRTLDPDLELPPLATMVPESRRPALRLRLRGHEGRRVTVRMERSYRAAPGHFVWLGEELPVARGGIARTWQPPRVPGERGGHEPRIRPVHYRLTVLLDGVPAARLRRPPGEHVVDLSGHEAPAPPAGDETAPPASGSTLRVAFHDRRRRPLGNLPVWVAHRAQFGTTAEDGTVALGPLPAGPVRLLLRHPRSGIHEVLVNHRRGAGRIPIVVRSWRRDPTPEVEQPYGLLVDLGSVRGAHEPIRVGMLNDSRRLWEEQVPGPTRFLWIDGLPRRGTTVFVQPPGDRPRILGLQVPRGPLDRPLRLRDARPVAIRLHVRRASGAAARRIGVGLGDGEPRSSKTGDLFELEPGRRPGDFVLRGHLLGALRLRIIDRLGEWRTVSVPKDHEGRVIETHLQPPAGPWRRR